MTTTGLSPLALPNIVSAQQVVRAVTRCVPLFRVSTQSTAIFGIAVLLFWVAGIQPPLSAQEAKSDSGFSILSVQSGIQGTWKVGFPTRHLVEIENQGKEANVRLVVRTVDGDGIAIQYNDPQWTKKLAGGERATWSVYAKHGRSNRPIVIELYMEQGSTPIESHLLSEEERGQVLPAEHPWVVGLGNAPMHLESAALKSAKGQLPDYVSTEVTNAIQIPDNPEGLSGIDYLVFSSSNSKLLTDINAAQSEAIRNWVRRGGKCLLTLGKNGQQWMANPALAALIPGQFLSFSEGCAPGPLESYLNSEAPLQAIDSVVLNLDESQPELVGQSAERARYPLISHWSYGMGRVRLLATEIDSPAILKWESQAPLVKMLLNDQWEGRNANRRDNLATTDLSVQLNNTLDQFSTLKIGNLTQMSIMLVLLLAILGPLDYFLIAKRWRRPRGTWLTLAFTSTGCCLFLLVIQSNWKPSSPSVNTLEIVDVDTTTNTILGKAYSHVYSGQRGLFDLAVSRTGWLASSSDTLEKSSPIQMDWFGQTGKTLGGFDSTVATDRLLPGYTIERSVSGKTESEGSSDKGFNIHGLGLPQSGTKSLALAWHDLLPSGLNFSQVSTVSGAIDLLEGSVANPLDVELLNGSLFYRGRFYSLPLRIRPGERVSFSVNVVPKDLTRKLQRRFSVAGEERGSPWDPSDTTDLKRLTEMLAFHRAAGATSYTTMVHRYLSELDLTDVLKTERAILFAELSNPMLQWKLERNGEPVELAAGKTATFVRILLPVGKPQRRAGSSGSKSVQPNPNE